MHTIPQGLLTAAAHATASGMPLWCIVKNNAKDAPLQAAKNWAGGQGGADCSMVRQGGRCHDPSFIERTTLYALNDYYLKQGLTDESSYLGNTAAPASLRQLGGDDPSSPRRLGCWLLVEILLGEAIWALIYFAELSAVGVDSTP